mmetsp:Transcript_23566/g.76769  ORF Transcript_23566/g.76769 Transcript_23566/m.76769 type:complete len:446 (+) Transcript_23566:110-1447(+)
MKRSISLSELRESLGDESVQSSTLRRVRSHENMDGHSLMSSGASSPSLQGLVGGARMPMLSEKELRDHFNMPLNEVAKKFGMCTTALKKLCRKYGVMQWPHRKLRSLEKKIASLKAEQRYTTDGQGNLDEEIRKLEMQREYLLTGNGQLPSESGGDTWSPGGDDDGGDFDNVSETFEAYSGIHRSVDDLKLNTGYSRFAPNRQNEKSNFSNGIRGNVPNMMNGKSGSRPSNSNSMPKSSSSNSLNRLATGGTNDENSKQLHDRIKTLEDENASLRALSQALMSERQELLNKLESSSSEIENLRNLYSNLQAQILIQNGGRPVKTENEHNGGQYMQHTNVNQDNVFIESRRRPGDNDLDGVNWTQGSMSPNLFAHGMSPHMNSVGNVRTTDSPATKTWQMQAQRPVPPMPSNHVPQNLWQSGANQDNNELHSLSWMAPDFDLDQLL